MSETRDLLVATDLDGCLLDASYSYEAARPALAALAREYVPLVLASSKTRAEMEPLVRVLGLDTPFVVENGGALVVPRGLLPRAERPEDDGPYVEIALGTPRRVLVEALHELAARAGVKVRGFAGLTSFDLERLTGLSKASAASALRRHYDEPFLVEGGDEPAARLASAAVRRGLVVTRGGQFHHLTGRVGKGEALARLLEVYGAARRRFQTVALGDAANDLSMLELCDRPIVVPRANGSLEPELAAALPRAERAPAPGPAGWNEAVLSVLRGERLPSVAG
ncbi:MAG: HAD-IIB family hydrolase [Vicinamibacteria bacterium]